MPFWHEHDAYWTSSIGVDSSGGHELCSVASIPHRYWAGMLIDTMRLRARSFRYPASGSVILSNNFLEVWYNFLSLDPLSILPG